MNLALQLFRRFTIRTRMLGAIAVVLALLALVGGIGAWGLQSLSAHSLRFVQETHENAIQLSHLREGMGNLRRYEKDLLLNYDKPEQVKNYLPKWQAALEATRQAAKALDDGQNDEGTTFARGIQAQLDVYAERAVPVFRQIEAGNFDGVGGAMKLLGPARAAAHETETLIGKIDKHLAEETVEARAAMAATTARVSWVFGAAVVLAIGLVVPLTLLNMVSICRPIDAARRMAETVASGDLTATPDAQGADEPAAMLRALTSMQEALRSLIGQVRSTTDGVHTAAAEIARGNADLSSRTEQTASNLQQTASSMEQLTGTVRQTADSARTATELASSAASVAERGGTVVSQVVSTMDEINDSSRKIADIIGVIDGIAFQTNILALNAAVEAARAGEQGRGFAVVAGEVRSLAQRSAEAAKEIKGLIGTSVGKVEAGARLVADAGSTMNEIVASVQRVTDIIGRISAATGEQSEGIGQVNSAVNQLDQMTQQNAALVEQSAAAADSLGQQAAQLAQVVGTFRLQPA
jgi:methyl-accepting chemotaxis protein